MTEVKKPNPAGSMSVRRFCRRHGISRSQFYVLHKQGRGPITFRPGRKIRISFASEADWITQMERDSGAATAREDSDRGDSDESDTERT